MIFAWNLNMSKSKDRWTQDTLNIPLACSAVCRLVCLCAWITCNPSHVEDLKYTNRHSANSLYSSFGWSTKNFFLASNLRFCFFCFFFLIAKREFHIAQRNKRKGTMNFKVQSSNCNVGTAKDQREAFSLKGVTPTPKHFRLAWKVFSPQKLTILSYFG